ncbi:MAG: molybdopterin cofactor-binding domain-containing protein [Xanthobacteraceae bacterium]|jgi:nicotinate dehydrogenase subunit B
MNTPTLPALLVDNPRLDQWVSFRADGKAVVSTGRVEIGQGVLTAMIQIAADELDIPPDRIVLQSGDTELTPNEGFTAGSQSIQFGGVALRMACAEVRLLHLERVAAVRGLPLADLAVKDGAVICRGAPTGDDYWTLAGSVDLTRRATGRATTKTSAAYGIVGHDAPRVDLAAKVFGEDVFMHDMVIDGMLHARVLRQPGRTASIVAIDEAAIHRSAKDPIEIVRSGNFLAIVGRDEAVVESVAVKAQAHVTWDGVEPVSAFRQEARSLLQQPSIDRMIGSPLPDVPLRGRTHEATFSRPYLAHASIAPSCALALCRDQRVTVWTHSQGVFPLRKSLAQMLKLEPAAIAVKHVQGAGCYGHNGADDAAADAAAIAALKPGSPIRVRWRREEEFAFEPVSPAMVVNVRATVDDLGRPVDWTTEIWSGTHNARPGLGNLLAAEALPDPPPPPEPADVPESSGGGATRNGEPLYVIPSKRIVHHLIPQIPVRTSALRGLGAMPNVFAIESFIDELAERAATDPVAYRLSLLSDARAKGVIKHVAHMCNWQERSAATPGLGIAFARYKNRAAYAAVVAQVDIEEEIRLTRVWCATDAGLVVNPDGAINQLEGGILQATSWVLKEQVRFDGSGVLARDWDAYPVLRFSDVPEVTVEFVNPASDEPPLGVGEATAGPTAAAIGNAVARALGTRLRDLPLTRERVMAALLSDAKN